MTHEPSYGRSPTDKTYKYRKFIHEHIVEQRNVEFALPTNTRAVYYVGKGEAWPEDHTGKGRKSSQYVSEAINWLIDKGLVDEDEIVDPSGHIDKSLGVVDLFDNVLKYARSVKLDPWAPNSVPLIICEGRNDLSLVQPLGRSRSCRWVALGGMAGRAHLRAVAELIDPDAPVGYVGDWNRSGHDIERNAYEYLRGRGWDGGWERLLITDEQAPTLSPKVTVDGRDGKVGESVESAALPVGEARSIINAWFDDQRPTEPTADGSMRQDIIDALAALR